MPIICYPCILEIVYPYFLVTIIRQHFRKGRHIRLQAERWTYFELQRNLLINPLQTSPLFITRTAKGRPLGDLLLCMTRRSTVFIRFGTSRRSQWPIYTGVIDDEVWSLEGPRDVICDITQSRKCKNKARNHAVWEQVTMCLRAKYMVLVAERAVSVFFHSHRMVRSHNWPSPRWLYTSSQWQWQRCEMQTFLTRTGSLRRHRSVTWSDFKWTR